MEKSNSDRAAGNNLSFKSNSKQFNNTFVRATDKLALNIQSDDEQYQQHQTHHQS